MRYALIQKGIIVPKNNSYDCTEKNNSYDCTEKMIVLI